MNPHFSACALILAVVVATTGLARAADFGTPPSGEVPILYNDHTVYAKPDVLKQARVLAALEKKHEIYVPLRSMFEQMGATVTASADGRTFTASKPGASVTVRLGVRSVTINGETRPLDVAPILYHGVVLVPIRVMSEVLGAYVLWVSHRRLVVVAYRPFVPTPAPAPIVTAPPTPPPAPVMVPTPVPAPIVTAAPIIVKNYHGFIAAAKARGNTYNEFSDGQWCPDNTYVLSAAYIIGASGFAVKVDFRQDAFVSSINQLNVLGQYSTRFSTIDGGTASVPVFLGKQNTLDGRLEYQIAKPHIYVGVGFIRTSTSYGYPHLIGVGAGLEKLPDLDQTLSVFGSAFYYPNVTGNYSVNGSTYRQSFAILKYDVGLALTLKKFPIYAYGGFSGDRYSNPKNAPVGQTHNGPYLGLGLKL